MAKKAPPPYLAIVLVGSGNASDGRGVGMYRKILVPDGGGIGIGIRKRIY